MKKISAFFIFGIVFFLACGGSNEKTNTIAIAVSGPMTGEQAKQGLDMKNGVTLCVDEWNERGGVLGKKINLVIGDDAQDPKQANSLANKFYTGGVVGVVGHFNSSCTIPASEIYQKRGIVMITPASTNPKVTDRGYSLIFRICGRDDQQGKVGAEYVVKNYPDAKVAILHDKTTYGQGLADEFRKNYESLSGKSAVYYGAIVKEDSDYTPVLTDIKSKSPNILYFGGLYPQGGLLVKQMRQAGLKATLVSGDGTFDPEFIRIAGAENADGSLLTFIPDQEKIPMAKGVVERYRKRFGDVGPYSLYSYEAANILFQGIDKRKSTKGSDIAGEIHKMTFKTIFGDMQFDNKGDVLVSPYVMWQVKGGKLQQIEEDYPDKK